MMDELQGELERLARDVPPARLALVEQAVLAQVAGHQFGSSEPRFRVGLLAGGAALVMGVLGGVLPADKGSAEPLTPLVEVSRLAPSSLLMERQ